MRVMVMYKGAMIMMLVVLALLGYGELFAGPRGNTWVASSRHPEGLTPAQGTMQSGQITPHKGEFPPAPELTPEQREQILQGTRIRVREGQCADAEPPKLRLR
jgi:hypothetical protein